MEFNFSWEQKREFTQSAFACPHPDAKPLGWFNSYMFGWLMPEVFKINGVVLPRADFGCLVLLINQDKTHVSDQPVFMLRVNKDESHS